MSKNADDQLARFLAVEYADSFDTIRSLIDGADGNVPLARIAVNARVPVSELLQAITYVPVSQKPTLGRVPDRNQQSFME